MSENILAKFSGDKVRNLSFNETNINMYMGERKTEAPAKGTADDKAETRDYLRKVHKAANLLKKYFVNFRFPKGFPLPLS